MFQRLFQRLSALFTANTPGHPKLLYSDLSKGGTIWYESVATRFSMWWEFAGGEALAVINIPSAHEWEAITHLPVSQREGILQFIGHQVIKDRNNGKGRFEVEGDYMTIYP